ncbi:lipid-A-disaccharide synthase [Phascolarctobacterium sp.]|uniref:lipid-A-disaccharide synthase n=1 Tax=Phascolarctobacterium sp. TaxID=2049039 RepID=UPI002A827ACE|nr:lipid-A-disaccharide synthase [Phascolarctobacterium sp.]MDY5044650.1 lipid-A-disaccharide synthase [Phascolarctobacterium sp.]
MAKILISAGEASGDIHAAAVTAALKKIDSAIEVFGMGGDALRAAGGEVLFDIKDHGVMGFVEVIKKLPDLFKLRSDFARVMDERKPDCLVVVDYPGFNMKLAKVAHDKGIPVVSYIAPSAWAWNKGRAKNVAKIVDKVACIFPFEYDVYEEAGAPVEFVGHPLLDIVHPTMERAEAEAWAGKEAEHPLVLLMPGSRLMEIEKMLPTLLEGAKLLKKQLPEVQFAMPRAGTIPLELLQSKIKASGLEIKITEGHNYDLFSVADLALATSGTVTLEAALCGLPSVIVYRTSALNAFIARRVINIPNIGLPNIVAGRQILPELLQEDFTPANVANTAVELLAPERRPQLEANLAYMKARLGEPGAVNRVAQLILRIAEERK